MYHITINLNQLIDTDPPRAITLPGVHVDSTVIVPAAEPYRVYPAAPCSTIAGAQTHYYRFENLAQAASFGFVQPQAPDFADEADLTIPDQNTTQDEDLS